MVTQYGMSDELGLMRKLLPAAHQRVRETLEEKRNTLQALAKLLIEEEVVDRNALATLLAAPRV
jgi:cell division protease FtsH